MLNIGKWELPCILLLVSYVTLNKDIIVNAVKYCKISWTKYDKKCLLKKKCRALCRAVLLTSWHSYIHITSLLKSIKPSGVAYSAQDTLNPPTRPRVSASQPGDPQRSTDSTETDPIQADHCNLIGQQAAQGSKAIPGCSYQFGSKTTNLAESHSDPASDRQVTQKLSSTNCI